MDGISLKKCYDIVWMFFALTSSKTTLTDYQCVSTGCCTYVAKTEITIDNQYVTKSLQRCRFLPKQLKENTEKITNLSHFLDLDYLLQVCLSYISANVATFLIQPILLYILQINKEIIPPIYIQPILSAIFVVFLKKSYLNRKIYVFRLFPTERMFPRLALTLCQAKIVLCFLHEWGLHPSYVKQIMAVMLAVKWQCP